MRLVGIAYLPDKVDMIRHDNERGDSGAFIFYYKLHTAQNYIFVGIVLQQWFPVENGSGIELGVVFEVH